MQKTNKHLNEPHNVNVNNIVISKLSETKTNSKYLIYLSVQMMGRL